jgi:hypothetical protein
MTTVPQPMCGCGAAFTRIGCKRRAIEARRAPEPAIDPVERTANVSQRRRFVTKLQKLPDKAPRGIASGTLNQPKDVPSICRVGQQIQVLGAFRNVVCCVLEIIDICRPRCCACAAGRAGRQHPTTPPVNFTNSSGAAVGSTIANLLDSYAKLMQLDPRLRQGPGVMDQNIETVIRMTRNRTAAQTLAVIHDDRTAQPYSVLNGLGVLTSSLMTGIGSSTTSTAPASLTPTSYVTTTLQDYAPTAQGINCLSGASIGFATFGDGTATPLAGAATFLNTTIRNNASTEPPKRTFERYMGSTGPVTNPASVTTGVISPLDARYDNYSAASNKTGLTTADTAQIVVPTYFSHFSVPAAYGYSSVNWVRGFTVTQALVTANGGKPITAPNVGFYDASGNFTPTPFNVGDYVLGIGAAPRPYRLSTEVNVPTQLWQVINGTNPYGDGAFISGHANLAYNQALGLAFLVPQQYKGMLAHAADIGNNRILAGNAFAARCDWRAHRSHRDRRH